MAIVNPDALEALARQGVPSFTINGRAADAPRAYAPPAPAVPQADLPPTRAEQAFADFEKARTAYRNGVAEVQGHNDLTDEGKAAQIRALASSADARKVDAAEADLLALRDEAADDYAAAYGKLRAVEHTPEGESKALRDSARHRMALDNAKSPTEKLRELINTVPDNELGVLLQEGPAHLAAHGQPTSWVEKAVEQRSPELAAARQRLEQTSRLVEVGQANAARLREGFQTGHMPTQVVDGSKLGLDPDAA
jgi:hypothetical protein